MASILVVCTGNICRSPAAEGFLRHALQERVGEDSPLVSSAGVAGWEGSPATPESVEAAAELGVDIGGHVARKLTIDDLLSADLIIAMAVEHRDTIARSAPEIADRTFTLKELGRALEAIPPGVPDDPIARVVAADELRRSGFAGNPLDEDIVDPLGMPLDTYRAVAWEIQEWCVRVADGLAGPVTAAISGEESGS